MRQASFLAVILMAMNLMPMSWGQQQTVAASGTISGFVLDAQGNPVSEATVTVRRLERSQTKGLFRASIVADQAGYFSVSACPFGNYFVFATDSRPQVNGRNLSLSGSSSLTTVAVSSQFPAASVTMQLGRSAASLSGRIRDAVTGQAISAKLQVKSALSGQTLITAGLPAEYRLSIPSRTDLWLEISAPGYSSWYFPGTLQKSQSSAFSMRSTITKEMDVLLQPLAK